MDNCKSRYRIWVMANPSASPFLRDGVDRESGRRDRFVVVVGVVGVGPGAGSGRTAPEVPIIAAEDVGRLWITC